MSDTVVLNNTIICLIGLSGIGKYTIAKHLAELGSLHVVDNHLTSNPIFSIIEQGHDTKVPVAAWDRIRQIREIVYETIETVSPPDFSFVFTNQLLDDDVKYQKAYDRLCAIAEKRQALFVPVRLFCNADENCKRIACVERSTRFKPTNPDNVAHNRHRGLLKTQHANTLDLNISALLANEAAVLILGHVYAVSTQN